jgi:hypothetical protein
MALWYFEQRTFDGRWTPCTSPVRPEERNADGRRLTLRAITEVTPPEYHDLTLDQMWELYSPDGRFQAVARDTVAA